MIYNINIAPLHEVYFMWSCNEVVQGHISGWQKLMPEEMFKSKLKSRLFTKVPIRPTKTGGSFVSVFRFFSFDLLFT